MPLDEKKCKFKNGQSVRIKVNRHPGATDTVGSVGKVEEGEGGQAKYLVRYQIKGEGFLREDYFGDEELEAAKGGGST